MRIRGEPFSILYIDADPLWRDLVIGATRRWSEVKSFRCTASGRSGYKECENNLPKVVIVDVQLADINGFQLIDCLNELPRPPRVLLLSSRRDEVFLFRAATSNIAGFLWKSHGCIDLIRSALREIFAGRKFFPSNERKAFCDFRRSADAFFKILSNREIALMPLLAEGRSDEDIALISGVRSATIHSHRQNIMAKLNLHRTPDLMRWGRERGFLERAI